MKKLIRGLSRVGDSSQYSLLRSETASGLVVNGRRRRRGRSGGVVPEGHIPVYVGEEMERFVVSAGLLNHPIFLTLLNRSAQEYGYQQKGVLRIPCHVVVFQRLLQALRFGGDDSVPDLLNAL